MNSRNLFRLCVLGGLLALSAATLAATMDEGRYPPMHNEASANMPPPPPAAAQSNAAPRAPQARNRDYRNPPPGPARPAGRPAPYPGGTPYGPGPAPYGARPYAGGPYGGPYGGPRPYGGYDRGPWGGNRGFGNWFGGNRGPYGGRDPFNSFFGGNRYGDGPFGNMFGRRGFGGRDGFLGMHPEDWMTGGEDGLEQMWDEVINAPSEMGDMPGGWSAPEVSMPNPVDVQRQFRDEAPEFVREVPDMININP